MHTLRDSPRNTTAADEAAVRMPQDKVVEAASRGLFKDKNGHVNVLSLLDYYETERRWLTR